jgi:iron complex outermembrane receptor protein
MKLKSQLLAIGMALGTVAANAAPVTPVDNEQDKTTVLEKIVVTDKRPTAGTLTESTITAEDIKHKQSQVQDTARLLEDVSGVSLQTGGGVSSIPIIHGLNDERVKVLVNGMNIVSACANHMNPPLSYIDRANVGTISILKGITPVSLGGDSIAGTISVESPAPVFAEAGKDILFNGGLSSFYKSNGNAFGGSVNISAATSKARIEYTGSYSQADNYKDGRGNVIGSSSYKNENHAVGLAYQLDNHLFEFKGGIQHIPFQGFPNQRMDMTNNDSIFGNIHYKGVFNWGNFDAKAYLESTQHAMDIADDKFYAAGYRAASGRMPMNTDGRNLGYKLQAEIPFADIHTARIGNEFVSNRINEWWSAVPGSGMMMGGTTGIAFVNLNNATRDRVGTYAEVESRWTPKLSSLLGFRYDHTMTTAGDVHGYTTVVTNSTTGGGVFNASARDRNFDTYDVTASLKFTPNDIAQFEFGYARKNRAPSIYELYPWNTSGMMMTMIGFAGDGNAYVGNTALKPETANNLSLTAAFHDATKNAWEFKVTPYFSYVDNFIDADRCGTNGVTCGTTVNATSNTSKGFYFLKYNNHDATLYGVDASGRADLYKNDSVGKFSARTNMSYVRGERVNSGNLYHIMPFNMKLGLDHQLAGWTSGLEMQFVDSKTDVQDIRGELKTPGYILLNAKTGYQWKKLSINVGIDNLLNKQYYNPMGGIYAGNYYTMSIGGAGGTNTNLPSMGRSVFVGVSLNY